MDENRHKSSPLKRPERGQALVEYALIVVLIGIAFGVALAATGPVISNVFENSISDLVRETEVGTIPDREDFWLTVTVANDAPPRDRPLPTNTPADPTSEPTDGPSPTPSNTPTPTPTMPTNTPTFTPTAVDKIFDAPIYDSIEDPGDAPIYENDWWRTDPNNFDIMANSLPWNAEFFAGQNLAGAPIAERFGIFDINFNGDETIPWIVEDGFPTTNFSARFTRRLDLTEDATLNFFLRNDDGVRVFVQPIVGETPGAIEAVTLKDINGGELSWSDQSAATNYSGFRHLNVGSWNLIVEYYQGTGNSRLRVNLTTGGPNPDDVYVSGGVPNPGGGAFSCNWGRSDFLSGNNANTELWLFDEYLEGDLPQNSRCHLEWRGAVSIPADMTDPELIFWDTWDFTGGGGVNGWLEVNEYIRLIDEDQPELVQPDREAMAGKWQRVDLRDNNTANYNWTHNAIDLTDYFNFNNPGFSRNIAFRFVIENNNAAGDDTRMWNIDDVEIRQREMPVWTVDHRWDLDTVEQAEDFIATGGTSNAGNISGFGLVSNNKLGASGMSWHDSKGPNDDLTGVAGNGDEGGEYTDYKRHTESPNSNDIENLRAHSLEIKGWVNLDDVPNPDQFGNAGPPVLHFFHSYHVGGRTGLAVQYTTDPYEVGPANWIDFPDGALRSVENTSSATQLAMQEVIVSLEKAQLTGNPSMIRIRFVMYVHRNANRLDGWWIDHIRLGRDEAPKWLDYPYTDDAQYVGRTPWRFTGQWVMTDYRGRPDLVDEEDWVEWSYSSSPGDANYDNGKQTWMEMRYPIDLFNDTPNKEIFDPYDPDNPAPAITNTYTDPAENPVLRFYHSRELDASDDLLLQWKRDGEAEDQWRTLWGYYYRMGTRNNSDQLTHNDAWEHVEVNLSPMMDIITAEGGAPGAGTGDDLKDDDVVFRIMLDADSSASDPGVYVDNIVLEEYVEYAFKLWPSDENRDDPLTGDNLGTGDGIFFVDEPDVSSLDRPWWEGWYWGGWWQGVEFESRTGVAAFHDSPLGDQGAAPGWDQSILDVNIGTDAERTPDDTFNVLEMGTIIDLRAADAETEKPALYFWNRYHIGKKDRIKVEVSYELTDVADMDAEMKSRCQNKDVPQCYEQLRGWSEWEEVWYRYRSGDDFKAYGWEEERVRLDQYAADITANREGKRIRIRFVLDATSTNNNRDGWYIDGVRVAYSEPPDNFTLIRENVFDDRARSLINWIPEGKWGLSPVIFQGGGGGPTSLGLWEARWWDCDNCRDLDPTGKRKYERGTDAFLQDPDRPAPDHTQMVTNISYDNGNGSPVDGWENDRFVGEFVLETPVVGPGGFLPGPRSFTTLSDDGVRIKVEEIDKDTGEIIPNTDLEWNVIENWTNHSPRTDLGSFSFEANKKYLITMQYFENSGGSVAILTTGDGRFSFTDSPKIGGASTKDEMAIPYAETSLIGNNVLDLTGMADNEYVLMEIQTQYYLHWRDEARVEVSRDGGFSWTQDNLKSDVKDADGNVIVPKSDFANASWDGDKRGEWQIRKYNLTAYKGNNILIRFRLDRDDSDCASRHDCNNSDLNDEPELEYQNGYYGGWWIQPVRVGMFRY